MKRKRNLLLGLLSGVLLGWIAGFFCLPFFVSTYRLTLGAIGILALASLVLIILAVWKMDFLGLNFLNKETKEEPVKKRRVFIIMITVVFILTGASVSNLILYNQNQTLKSDLKEQDYRVEQQAAIIDSVRNSNLAVLMTATLDKIDSELKDNPERILSDETIANIAALSYSLKPYRYLNGDSLSEKKYSPERGQLLMALSLMNLDSSTFEAIKQKTTFANADLKGADFRERDLSRADLQSSNLKEARLEGTVLIETNLSASDLSGSLLLKANLRAANLNWVNFRWADLGEANLSSAEIFGSDFTDAKLRKTNFSGATLKRSDLTRALLNEAKFVGANLKGTGLRLSVLTNSDFTKADISEAVFTGSNMTGVILDEAVVDREKWFEKIVSWKVAGASDINDRYKMVDDTTGQSKYQFLEK